MTSPQRGLWIPGVKRALNHQPGKKSRKTKSTALLQAALSNLQLVNMYESAPLQLWMTYCFPETAESRGIKAEDGSESQPASPPS